MWYNKCVVRGRRKYDMRRGRIKARDKIDPLLYINPHSYTYHSNTEYHSNTNIYKGDEYMNLFEIGARMCKVGRTSITVCDERGKTCGVVRNLEILGKETQANKLLNLHRWIQKHCAAPEAVEMAVSATYTVDDGTEYMYTARVGGVDVGGASVIVYDDGDAYIERIDVDTTYRNRGYGSAMLKQLAAMYGAVYLAPDNDDSRRLYARLGDDVTSKGSWSYVDQGYGVYSIAA